jgi:hypothetical protein
MMDFENRSGAYIQVREHRKRRKLSFAGRHGVNNSVPYAALSFAIVSSSTSKLA